MKEKLIFGLKMLSKYTFYGLAMQILLCTTLFVRGGGAQSLMASHIKLEKSSMTLREIFSSIEKNSRYRFFYDEDLLSSIEGQLNVTGDNVLGILTDVSKATGLEFKRINKNIYVTKNQNADGENSTVQAKVFIKGRVVDEEKEPLIGVTVFEKGTTNGSVTDINGDYMISVNTGSTLVFQFVGYTTVEEQIGNRSSINVELKEDVQQLEDVVVTALGIERQAKSLGYATQAMKGSDIAVKASPNIANSMSGRIAGVQITQPNGIEGGTTRIVIRGISNLQGNNQPLIVVDGVPIDNTPGMTSAINGQDWGSGLNNINPDDIERFDVLKGAAASALYGARGTNGVIMITTKKGKNGNKKGLGVSYSFMHRVNKPYLYQDMQNVYGQGGPVSDLEPTLNKNGDGQYVIPKWWGDVHNPKGIEGVSTWDSFSWFWTASSWGPKMDGTMVKWWDGEMRPFSPQPDNQKIYHRDGLTARHNISISKGGDMGSFRFSVTRLDNKAIVPNTNFDQTTLNLGADINISKKLKTNLSFSYIDYNRNNTPVLGESSDGFGKAMIYVLPRNYKGLDKDLYVNPDGTRNDLNGFADSYSNYHQHIWWKTMKNNESRNRRKLLGSATMTYQITDWLSALVRTGMDSNNEDIKVENSPTDLEGLLGGKYSRKLFNNTVMNHEALLMFSKDDILPDFNMGATVGANLWHHKKYGLKAETSTNRIFPNTFSINNDADNPKRAKEDFYERKLHAVFGMVNVSYKDMLFLEVTGRNDWSSTLPTDVNSYFYPSANVGFAFTEVEGLTEGLSWLNYGKLRLAVAKTATDADPYAVHATYNTGNFANSATYKLPNVVPALDLKPTQTDAYEIGLDLELLNSKIFLDATYYVQNTYNQILKTSTARSSGAENFWFNTGEVQNKGLEVAIRGIVLDAPQYGWETEINFAKNNNYVKKLHEKIKTLELQSLWGSYGPSISVEEGDRVGTIYGYDYLRDDNGRRVVNDAGTHYYSTKEKVALGNSTPDWLAGFTNTFRYKSLRLRAHIDAKIGGDVYAGSYATALLNGLSPETLSERMGNGLPYTDSEGNTRNVGVKLGGVHKDGSPNDKTVHYIYKYMSGEGSGWGDWKDTDNKRYNFIHEPTVVDNTWVNMREISLTYDMPQNLVKKVGFIQGFSATLSGHNLFYIYRNMPDDINPEGVNGAGMAQGIEWGAFPGVRSYSFALNVLF
ncbi:SusC/RagA family TonB-linked outer membrane protein [Fulvitalea axinellae]|uniref:SusC/RagA family TonB-linked outer membrane protein n=1 Tax=Fulvitalea axinellae TaxID=1182444 RepID=A0AAU9D887_9BACT|nr:SusC/RagA family TonB-linked outer membrane protein [Fulvitalea axinellae]